MKKIIYSNITRVFAFLLMELLVVLSVGMTYYLGNTSYTMDSIKDIVNGKSYIASQRFQDQIVNNINTANNFLESMRYFEVAGEYNGNKEVTLSEFLDKEESISNYSTTQTYRLQDLVDWSQQDTQPVTFYEQLVEMISSDDADDTSYIISYLDKKTMESVISPTLESSDAPENERKQDLLVRLQKLGYNITMETMDTLVKKEPYKTLPLGSTIIKYCFQNDDFSELGKINEEMQTVLSKIQNEYQFYKKYETLFKGLDRSNFKIYIQDYKQEVILNNCIDTNTNYQSYFETNETNVIGGGVVYNAETKEFYYTDYVNDDLNLDLFKIPGQVNYIYAVGVDLSYPHNDEFLSGYKEYTNTENILIAMLISGVVILLCFIYLTAVAGRKAKDEVIYLNGFDQSKTEIGASIMLLLGIVDIVMINEFLRSRATYVGGIITLSIGVGLFVLGFLSLVKRIKAGELWKNSIVYGVLHWICIFFKYRKATTKTFILYSGYIFITFLVLVTGIGSGNLFVFFIWFLFVSAVGFFLLKEAVARQSILNGIEKISEGDLEYKINASNLSGGNEILANAINNIGEGLHNAVDASVRNERLKTDLITNVSHDIKTPLTSIINYVDLLKRENIEDEKIRGYIEILDSKSQRLKNLTEDLVEASKISSGNIKLEMSKIDFVELINQTEGEFSEKFERKGLQIIKTLPKEHVLIEADGRRMWRVVENLYNNVAKYAMGNTRVYVDVKTDSNHVLFSIKNISESPLNIEADELTERFIRGDISRSTEGSGLGLSIAKNLTTLQNGSFQIYLDGDLFRVTIAFPRVES